jgi:hypothetical protein
MEKTATYQYGVAPSIQRNRNDTILTPQNMSRSQPIRHYRKEIASPTVRFSVPRTLGGSRLIDQLNSPGGMTYYAGIVPTIDPTVSQPSTVGLDRLVIDYKAAGANFFPGNTTEHPGQCDTCSASASRPIISIANDARRRVRTSGIIQPNYNLSYHQYHHRRNRSFQQNQYNYLRTGDASVKPGENLSLANVYAPQDAGFNDSCAKYNVPYETQFKYQWTTGGVSADIRPTTVVVPAGQYSITDLVNLLRRTMDQHGHYYVNTSTGNTHVYLLDFVLNASTGRVEITTYFTNEHLFPSNSFVVFRSGVDQIPSIASNQTFAPYVIFDAGSAQIAQLLGFASPSTCPAGVTSTDTTAYWIAHPTVRSRMCMSSYAPKIGLPLGFVKVYYKPNNAQYAQQGAVDAGARLTRLKYNTITSNAGLYATAFGSAMGSALSYGIGNSVYSYKSKLAFPSKCTPKVNAVGKMDSCRSKEHGVIRF